MNDRRDEPFAGSAADAARLMQEVQDLGFQAARTVVERFIELFDQFASGTAPGTAGRGDEGAGGGNRSSHPWLPSFQQDVQRAADLYLAGLSQLSEAGIRYLDATRSWQPSQPDQAGVHLPDVRPGGRVSSRLWLHNTTASAAVNLRTWCPGLTNHRGTSLPPATVTCIPVRIDHLDPGASREVLITVAVEHDAAPGSYHGQLLVDGLPDAAFPIRVTVLPGANAQ